MATELDTTIRPRTFWINNSDPALGPMHLDSVHDCPVYGKAFYSTYIMPTKKHSAIHCSLEHFCANFTSTATPHNAHMYAWVESDFKTQLYFNIVDPKDMTNL